MSRLFIGRSKLSDSWMQENAMGILQVKTVKDFEVAAQWAADHLVLRGLILLWWSKHGSLQESPTIFRPAM